jgi:hypothetical protein
VTAKLGETPLFSRKSVTFKLRYSALCCADQMAAGTSWKEPSLVCVHPPGPDI